MAARSYLNSQRTGNRRPGQPQWQHRDSDLTSDPVLRRVTSASEARIILRLGLRVHTRAPADGGPASEPAILWQIYICDQPPPAGGPAVWPGGSPGAAGASEAGTAQANSSDDCRKLDIARLPASLRLPRGTAFLVHRL